MNACRLVQDIAQLLPRDHEAFSNSSSNMQSTRRLTDVAESQRDNLILQHSEGIRAPVHDVQLGEDT